MLRAVHCTNFRGFRSFDAGVEAVTAFLGPNSSGKTTALHAVRFACDALRLAIDADRPARVEHEGEASFIVVTEGTLVDFAKLAPVSDWRALFVDQLVGEGVALSVTLRFDEGDPIQSLAVTVACARNEQLKLTVSVCAAEAVAAVQGLAAKSRLVNERLTRFLQDHAPVAVFVPPFYGAAREEEYRARAVVDRLLGAGDQNHVVRNLVVGLEPDQFDRLNAFLRETLGAKLTARTPADDLQRVTHLAVHFSDSNGDIELSAAGAGLVHLVAMYAALSRWRSESGQRRVIFLLDEPEAHLHPRLQAEMTERLGRLITREFGAQLLLATHSVDILNRLSAAGALLIRCERTAAPSAVALAGDAALFDDLASWVDLIPYTAINFLASRRVMFCEGTDELNLLPKLAALRFRNDPRRAERFRAWALVPLAGASNAPIADLLARLVRNDVVRARAERGDGFHVEVVLDRDHQRTPGTTERAVEGVREVTTVWSKHSLESLLLQPGALATWVRAFAEDCAPVDLTERVAAAIAGADADDALNDAAIDQLTAKLVAGGSLGGRSEQAIVHAIREARERVAASPATWQRGKDRGKHILQALREHIALPRRNQFPTDMVRLVQLTNADRIGDPNAAIPGEVGALLERITSA